MGAFFGKFLIEKNIVDSASVIKALSTQMESQPSTLRILKDKNILADDKIVEIIAYTSNTGKSLISALKEKNLLSEDQIMEIAVERTKSGMSFAEALIQHSNVEPQKLQELLKEYEAEPRSNETTFEPPQETSSDDEEGEINAAALESLKELGMMDASEIEELEKSVSSTPDVSIEVSGPKGGDDEGEINAAALESLKELGMMDESEIAELEKSVSAGSADVTDASGDEGEINAAALESLKELGMLDESELAELESSVATTEDTAVEENGGGSEGLVFHGLSGEFLKLFDQGTLDKLNEAPKKMAQGLEKDHINEIHQSVCTLLGAARMAGLQFSEKLLDCWDAILTKILNDQMDFAEINMLSISKAFKETVSLTKDLRDNIEKTNSENALLTNADWKNKFMATLKSSLAIAGKR